MAVSEETLKQAYREGRFVPRPVHLGFALGLPEEPYWCDGCGHWMPYSQCPWCEERRKERRA